ncbi:YsnF/AvaK domain-containing protein [Allosalinactinospora lopnorensis]|uniref:YsnF/AvaK domain-containing protein n=1 Tax=Allosalinactinospora lopnorensis TaxID=1352348 RepID=UPI000623CF3C|nr:YsnF/AvaK domain-containing protein [Allosalinactinospora lopnorensis]
MRPQELIGHHLLDSSGENIGKIGHVFYDDASQEAKWVTVRTGLFGTRECFVPVQGARPVQEDLQVPFDKQTVKDAPHFEADTPISSDEERDLYEHYGLDIRGGRGSMEEERRRSPQQSDASYVTRSEERADIGVERREAGKARVRKTVESEEFSETVPVTHEELRVEREPVTEADAPGPQAMEPQEEEITLHAERPVVSKRTESVERIKVSKEEVTEDAQVRGEVRKERVELEEEEGEGPDRPA